MTDILTRIRSLVGGVLRMVVVMGLLSAVLAAGVHGVAGGLSATVPDAEFGYAYDGATDTLEITHEGGDALDARALQVAGVEAACVSGEWRSGSVRTDDTCVVEGVSHGAPVRIVWNGDGATRATLDVWAAPGG